MREVDRADPADRSSPAARPAAACRTLAAEIGDPRGDRAPAAKSVCTTTPDAASAGAGADGDVAAACRTLAAELGDPRGDRAPAAKRVCIATPDVAGAGAGAGGDVGTAYHHLARLLAAQGHAVTIAWVNDGAGDEPRMEEARARYAALGIAFEPVLPRPVGEYVLDRDWAATWTLLDWLRARAEPFDVVHTPDREALGYGPLLAKSLGLAFGATHFVVTGVAPTLWEAEGDRRLVATERELGWVFMERRCAELADTLVCTSRHLVAWMRAAGYALPARTFVSSGPVFAPEGTPDPAARQGAARGGARLREVVFFGRLEWGGGLVLFLDAVDRLARQGRAPARVTFLGGVSEHLDGLDRIRRRSRDWPAEVRTIPDPGPDEALAYLSQPGRFAVMPPLRASASMAILECLRAGVPFLATDVGGTPEVVAPEDHARVLVPPDHIALGEGIAARAAAPLHPAQPRQDLDEACAVWSRWHARTQPFEASAARFAERARAAAATDPPVTVCIVHHERPALLRIAVDSVLAQDYPALEAVLVDDGSTGADALAALAAVESELGARGWRVLRQENRYPGAARNAAAAAARGEWLLFLDDDNALFPDAVSRLVRAARFSGADCVSAASVRFSGEGDPRTDPRSHGAPIRFLGASRPLNLIHNVAGDTCALVRRGAFEAVGGFAEDYGIRLDDMDLCNRLIRAGSRIETLPDPAYYYRIRPAGEIVNLRDRRVAEASRSRAIAPYVEGLPAEDRAFVGFATACITDRMEALRQRLADRDGELGAREHRIEALNTVLAERDGQIADQHQRIGTLHTAVIERGREVAALDAARTALVEELGESNRLLDERHGEIMALTEELGESSRLLDERHGEIMALVGKVEDLWASRSWRLTRPLRGASRLVAAGVGRTRRGARLRGSDPLRRLGQLLLRARTHRPGSAAVRFRAAWPRRSESLRLIGRFLFHARTYGLGSALRRARGTVRVRWKGAAHARAERRAVNPAGAAVPGAPPPGSNAPATAAAAAAPAAPAPPPAGDPSLPPCAMLVQDLHDGGLEKVVVDLAEQLRKLGADCPILVTESGGRAAKLAEELGCDVRTFGGDVKGLVSTVGAEGIEVVVTHNCYTPLEALANTGVRIVEVLHNAYSWQPGRPWFASLRERCVERFVAVSDFVRDYAITALRVPADRVQVIENGLSRYGLIRPALQQLAARRTAAAAHPVLACLANAHPQKNHVALVRAVERIVPDHAGIRLVLAGAIDDSTRVGRRVRQEIASKRLGDHVQCPGPLDRRALSRLLADAHVGLLPSAVEGFSIASLEYAYFGLPTVLSDTGAARRLRDGYGHVVIADAAAVHSGQLKPATLVHRALEPEPAAVAGIEAAIRTVLADYPKLAESAAQAGADWERYSIERVAGRYRELLAEVAA